MKNYRASDYALNKFSKGIVYSFADGTKVTILPEDYSAESASDGSALDWKAISDADYLDQVRADCRQTRKDVSLYDLEHLADHASLPLIDEYIEKLDKLAAVKAFDALLASGKLSRILHRRIRLRVEHGLTLQQIADVEGVTKRAAAKSIYSAVEMLQEYFVNNL